MYHSLAELLQRITRLADKALELAYLLCLNKSVTRRKSSKFTATPTSASTSAPTVTPPCGVEDDIMTYYDYGREDMRVQLPEQNLSQFDRDLCDRWDEAMENGVFRYDLAELQTKVIDGPHRYIATLNVKRATDRRPPESMHGLNQPFDSNRFNFNKIKSEEILMHIRCRERDSEYRDKVIANVSPGDYGHSLLVPQIDSNYNQNLTEHGIKLALDVMCLSSTRAFRIGFNSLCAHASVNHQHLHCYYNTQTLPAETMTATPISDDVCILDSDSPTGYGFELSDVSDIALLAKKIFSCTDYMRKSEIAHCLFMTRGPSFKNPSQTVIRVLLWPRIKVVGAKCLKVAFNSAVWEMAGHLLVKNKEAFNTLTDESAYQCLKEACLPDDDFQSLTETVLQLTRDTYIL